MATASTVTFSAMAKKNKEYDRDEWADDLDPGYTDYTENTEDTTDDVIEHLVEDWNNIPPVFQELVDAGQNIENTRPKTVTYTRNGNGPLQHN